MIATDETEHGKVVSLDKGYSVAVNVKRTASKKNGEYVLAFKEKMAVPKWTLGILIMTCLNIIQIHTVKPAPDLTGRFCYQEEGAVCCIGRQDSCAFPILGNGTLCYCDTFCENHEDDDCCPDYLFTCKGVPTPSPLQEGCRYGKSQLRGGETVWDNCNSCTCAIIGNITQLMCDQKRTCLIEPRIVDTVNMEDFGWRASNYSAFWGKTLEEGIKYKLGTLQPERFVLRMNPVRRIYDPNSLISDFDSGAEWPGYISGIEEQGWCGSSWAVSTAAVASDR
ncbi:hypothetical protein Trydic_g15788 [Trypoxylus dichotomus]